MRTKLPFSIGQIGKAFRNEITPGNFTFRTIEFEQMEYQTFCKPGTDMGLYNYFKEYGKRFYMDLGLPEDKLRFHDHEKLVFYAKAACDIEYEFPFGWGEVNGTHNRTNYDLSRHQEYSGKSMEYLDPETNEKYIPYIIESTYGVGRTVLALLFDAYKIWREKALLESAILLSRITRSGIVRKVSVEVGDMPKEQVQQTLRRVKELFEQKSAINTGNSFAEYTPFKFSPGMFMNFGRPAPLPMNTASKPYSLTNSSIVIERPITMLVSTLTPKATKPSISFCTIDFGKRNSGIP